MRTTDRPRARNRLAAVALLIAAVLGLTTVQALNPVAPASAASYGPGWTNADNGGLGFLGAYRHAGINVYCLDLDVAPPMGNTTGPTYGGWAGLSANDLARINWAVSTYGQSSDRVVTAAVALYVWSLADAGTYNSHGMSGDTYYVFRVPSASQRAAVLSTLAEIRAGAAGITAGTSGGSGQLVFTVDPANDYEGTLRVINLNPSNATGTIVLTNGIFDTTGSNTIAGVGNNATLPIRGVPPEDAVTYKISATGTFTAPGGYAGQIAIYTTPGQQPLAGPGGAATSNFTLNVTDPQDRSTLFRPIASTTVVSEAVAKGEPFRDVITFALGADEDGTVNEWRRSATGAYLPVTARGTVYGPYTDRPQQSPTVPSGAPVAGHFTVTTSTEHGPTIPYQVETEETLDEAGYYVAVVTIDWADQSAANPPVQRFIPEGYHFQDDFGQLVETSIVPFSIEFSTQLSANEAVIGDEITDHITPRLLDGAWLRDGGTRVPVEVTGTWYYSATEPVRSSTAPADAEVVAVQTDTLTGPGTVLETEPVQMPYREGWVTVQWCSTASIFVGGFCDDYGVPAETVRLDGPTITTKAQEAGVPTDTVTDTATVVGPVPASGMDLTFAGYLQPTDATEPVCTPETLVYSSSEPIRVTQPGDYTSEPFEVLPEHVGTVYWVETAAVPGTSTVIHTGECGLPEETTVIAWPTVVTQAIVGGGVGGEIHDVATVDGLVPTSGIELTFAGYLQPEDADEPICTAETVVFESSEPVFAVAPGDYVSEGFPVMEHEVGTIYWVETATVRDAEGGIVWQHVGECGLPNETTRTVHVTTKATGEVELGSPARDTAIVRGPLPDAARDGLRAELTFEAFRASGDAAVCTDDTRVFSTADQPIVITEPGEYVSASTTFDRAGTYYWVETVTFVDVETGDRTVAHVGECGLPEETTVVTSPPLALTGANSGVLFAVAAGLGLAGLLLAAGVYVTRRRGAVSTEEVQG